MDRKEPGEIKEEWIPEIMTLNWDQDHKKSLVAMFHTLSVNKCHELIFESAKWNDSDVPERPGVGRVCINWKRE